ncbi:hypothetical protein NEOLEDRAFT_1135956 [Neolentinus lepideus HHB14362 ss-1]|uniref:Uncharacterized protein n=1 Tax=Neolentinus lepideus HHB14362 ss-1 TaxID=1314782 RepID=A0A165RHA8_9AGAM|nr:hypothetical protein NEOLEDRAFT_1135956 [Neolentinus lepideus HHB14362 ss-1]
MGTLFLILKLLDPAGVADSTHRKFQMDLNVFVPSSTTNPSHDIDTRLPYVVDTGLLEPADLVRLDMYNARIRSIRFAQRPLSYAATHSLLNLALFLQN